MVTRYGGEERIAEAYRAWSGKQPDTIFEKIRSFFATIYEALFTPNQGDEFSTFGSVVGGRWGAVRDYRTADRVFGDMGSGEIWRRTPRLADEAGSVSLAPMYDVADAARHAATKTREVLTGLAEVARAEPTRRAIDAGASGASVGVD